MRLGPCLLSPPRRERARGSRGYQAVLSTGVSVGFTVQRLLPVVTDLVVRVERTDDMTRDPSIPLRQATGACDA